MDNAGYILILLSHCIFAINNVSAQTWIQKADFGGPGRYFASGFSIGNKGYIGLGTDNELNDKKDFWEYDRIVDTWTQKPDYTGTLTERSVSFSIGNKGYIVTDQSQTFMEYDPVTNIWNQKANYPGAIIGATSFSIGTKGYIVTGEYTRDLWEWDGDTASNTYNTWIQKAPFPPSAGRYGATAFSIGTKGYLATGTDGNSFKQDLWEWDGDTLSVNYNTWVQKNSLPGVARIYAVCFSIGSFGFIGTGLEFNAEGNLKDFWRWDQVTDTWTQMPDLPGPGRQSAVAFSIGNNGYIGTGYGGFANPNLRDFWEFCDTCYIGINEPLDIQSISIYPSPTSDLLYIRNADLKNSLAEIFNIYGSIVYSEAFTGNLDLDISDLACGLYIIKIKNNSLSYSTKLIIKR